MTAKLKFDGTPVTVISGTGTLGIGNYSTSSTATETQFDNATTLWPLAKAVLSCSFATAPDDQSLVYLYMWEEDIESANDETGPAATDVQGAKLVGSFKLHDVTSQQFQATIISLIGVRKAKFSILNAGGQIMDADFAVYIEGLSYEDAA